MEKVFRGLNWFFKLISTVFVAVLVFLAISLVGVRLLGLDIYAVLSGSMEPTYPTGSVIYVKEVDPATLQVGDPVTFSIGEDATATHRIISMVPAENDPSVVLFQTKGDANDAIDAQLVGYEDVIGKPIFSIPYLGFVADFIHSRSGFLICIVVVVLMISLTFFTALQEGIDKEESSEQNGEGSQGP